jgi:DNA-binding NtrC family response regulator
MGYDDQILKFVTPAAPPLITPITPRQAALNSKAVELDSVASALLGDSPASTQIRAHARRVAPYFRSLSLTGEPGCGEEAVARLLHQMCPLQDMKFVLLDAARAEERFAAPRPVASEQMKEGLLYLSEAERLSKAAQEGLLRMLRMQAGQSTRVVAFTGRGLKPYISAGLFLPELAGNLGSLRMALPTLRERAADIPMLLHCRVQQRRLAQAARGLRVMPLAMSNEFLEAAKKFEWPGNLPQMYAAMDWLMEHCSNSTLDDCDLTSAVEASGQQARTAAADARLVKLDRIVQEHVRSVLMACNGNKLKAAEVLGISRSTLYRMLDAADGEDLLMVG